MLYIREVPCLGIREEKKAAPATASGEKAAESVQMKA
jgi:hypothetical protein